MAISWNDLNDQSELSDASDQSPKSQNKQPENLPPTSLQKVVSNPQPKFKPRQDPNDKIAQSLKKLSIHEGQYVWLFFCDNTDGDFDVVQAIKSIKGVKKVLTKDRFINFEVETKNAEELIEKGYFQKGIRFRFSYSTKNEPFEPRSPRDNLRRPQKKYSEKNTDSKQGNLYEAKSPNSKYRFQQKKNYGERVEKKRVKYIAKESTKQDQSQKKVEIEQISQKNQSSCLSSDLNKKQSIQSAGQQKKQTQVLPAENKKKIQQKQDTLKKSFSQQYEKKQNQSSKEEQLRAQAGQLIRDNGKKPEEPKQILKQLAKPKDQSDLSSQQKQEIKEKKKKNKKKAKKGNVNNDAEKKKVYGNNPFSSLMN